MIEESNVVKWKPKGGDYVVSCKGLFNINNYYNENRKIEEFGLAFETREQADRAYKDFRFYHRLYKIAEELNNGWIPNWSNTSERKYIIYYSYTSKSYNYNTVSFCNRPGSILFKSEQDVREAIVILERGDV